MSNTVTSGIFAPHMTTKKSILQYPAQFISYLLHPLFMPLYLMAFLLRVTPEVFAANSDGQKNQLLLNILLNLVFFPALTMLLLKQLRFISSYLLPDRKERIIPVFAYTVFSFWVWAFVLMKNPANYPIIAVRLGLGLFISSALTLVCNAFYKISLHSIGAGMLAGLFIKLCVAGILPWFWLGIALAVALIIILSRAIVSDHSRFELYSGFMVGLLPQLFFQFLLL
jgi:hypothetical protein